VKASELFEISIGGCRGKARTALANDRWLPDPSQPQSQIRTHERYNPAGVTALNVVPGLLGTILTLTMLILTALSRSRARSSAAPWRAFWPCRKLRRYKQQGMYPDR
jgi:hypothetical protein